MWRGPHVLQSAAAGIAGAAAPSPTGGAAAPLVLPSRAPVSLLDLFLDIVT